jgi:hypothetical protein
MIAGLVPQAVTACVTTYACVGITVWGVRDPDSWHRSRPDMCKLFSRGSPDRVAFTESIGDALQA